MRRNIQDKQKLINLADFFLESSLENEEFVTDELLKAGIDIDKSEKEILKLIEKYRDARMKGCLDAPLKRDFVNDSTRM